MQKAKQARARVEALTPPSPPTYGAELLVSALEDEAINRRHTAKELAAALGIHPAHWYRLRATPRMLTNCERSTLQGIATYLGWPLGRVLLACDVVTQKDFEVALGGEKVVSAVILQIERGALGTGLVTPLQHAARDHQILVAQLYLAIQSQGLRTEPITTAGASH